MGADVIETMELMVRENKRDGWKETISPTEDRKDFERKLIDIVEDHGPTDRGSYHAVFKVNGGYGQNHETGATLEVNWKGRLEKIYSLYRMKTEGREFS